VTASNPVPSGASESSLAINPQDLLRAVVRRKWWILASTLLVGAAVGLGTARQPKVYEANAQILIEPALPKVLADDVMIDDLSEQSRTERAFYNTQYQIIRSRPVVRDAIVRLDLWDNAKFLADYGITMPPSDERERMIEVILLEHLVVVPELNSRIVKLVVEDFEPDRAARIANAIADSYINYSLERRLSNTRGASKWLDERVDEFAQKIEEAERSLNQYKTEHMLVSMSVEDRQNMISTSLAKLTERMVEVRSQLIDLESRRQVLIARGNDEVSGIEGDIRIAASPAVSELKRALAELYSRRAEISARYGELHPNRLAIDKQISEVEGQLKREVAIMMVALDNEIASLKQAEQGLNVAMEQEKGRALELNTLGLDYNKLDRDLGANREMYASLVKRQTEASLSGLLESNFVRWHQKAEVQNRVVRPSVPKNVGLGLFLGMLLGVGIAVAGVLLDTTVHSQADIEALSALPFLGILPSISDDEQKQAVARTTANGTPVPTGRDLYIVQNPTSSVAECTRAIRTNLLFLSTDRPFKRLLLTSAGPGEGKSTTAVALGITMAQAGARVLLVDTDLRKPRLHRTFGVPGEGGLTSVLVDTLTLDQAIKATDIAGLDILPCGPLPPNPAEILHTDRFAKLVEQLDARYDRIIFDSPPVHAVTDAVILSQITEGTIFVVKASKTTKESVRRALRRLRDVNARLLGVVLNDLDLDESGDSYGYYYYHSRYGTAYGAETEKSAEA
jgi:polysaccharide biosynthesis transport protein